MPKNRAASSQADFMELARGSSGPLQIFTELGIAERNDLSRGSYFVERPSRVFRMFAQ